MQCLKRPVEGTGLTKTGVTKGFEPTSGYQELNQSLLEEQPEPLTGEPYLQPLLLKFGFTCIYLWSTGISDVGYHVQFMSS